MKITVNIDLTFETSEKLNLNKNTIDNIISNIIDNGYNIDYKINSYLELKK